MTVDIPIDDLIFAEETPINVPEGNNEVVPVLVVEDIDMDVDDVPNSQPVLEAPVVGHTSKSEYKVNDPIDVLITRNQVKSWWCATIVGKDVKNGQIRYHVRPIFEKIKPCWITSSIIRPCTHAPQIRTPHGGIITVALEDIRVGPNRS